MPAVAFTRGLHRLAEGSYAYLHPSGSWGQSNSGVVTNANEALLVDTQFTLDLTRRLLADIRQQLPGVRISTVVTTHANGDHCWGNQLLPDAQRVASAATAAEMPQEIDPQAMTTMITKTPADSPMGAYMRAFFGGFDFTGIVVTPPTRTFTGQLRLQVGDRPVELIEVGPAHSSGDVIVHLPDTGVVFAGDILFVNDHPIMWAGPIDNWIAACDRILATGAQIIVPGHGPVTYPPGVRHIRGYLEYVATDAARQYAAGVPYHQAAARLRLHDYPDWRHPERLVVTYASIYRHLGYPDPGGRPAVLDRMAQRYQQLHPTPPADPALTGAPG